MTDIVGGLTAAGQAGVTGVSGFLGLLSSSAAANTSDASLGGVSLQQFTTDEKITFGVGIPESATASAPYDMLLSMTAPATVGWASVAMGGGSTYPLNVHNPPALIA